MMGIGWRIAISCADDLADGFRPPEPVFTVASFATTTTSRPSTTPSPA
jgi:hypothetical protein